MNNYMKQKIYQKNIAWMYILILAFGTIASLAIPQQEMAVAQDTLIIPDEAIRLRILANSDNDKDQEVKRAIRDAVNAEITKWVEDLTSIDDARELIKAQLPVVEEIARKELADWNLEYSVDVDFGQVQFPTKLYGQFLYPAGTYEAIMITLGEGSGANWWCVLFPPLCFLDFSTSLAVNSGFEEDPVETVDKPVDSEEVKNTSEINEEKTSENPPAYVAETEDDEVKVRFFLADLFSKWF